MDDEHLKRELFDAAWQCHRDATQDGQTAAQVLRALYMWVMVEGRPDAAGRTSLARRFDDPSASRLERTTGRPAR